MAEAFATDIAKSLLRKLGSFAVQEFCLAWGLEADLEGLKGRLSAINAVLLDAESQQSQNERIRLWLQKLKEVLHDAEDVLDEFECEALRSQVVKTTGSTGRKVRRFFSSSNKLAFRIKMGHKIKDLIDRLAEIKFLKSDFGLSEQTNDHSHDLQGETEMNPFIHSLSGLIGRDEDKEVIISLLLEPFEDDDDEHPFVIPIVGMGGLGKTALAKSVYDDESVNDHFELKMMVCVSDNFALKQVIPQIIKSATGEKCNDLGEGEVIAKIESILNGKKYLLVLDDVWDEDPRKWLLWKPLFSKGGFGSTIMVTTRSQRVAEIMGTVPAYKLSPLDQEDCLSLFYKCAFKDREEEHLPHLVEIGREIVEKCKQIPLAVINLGTQLYGKTDEREWKSVRDSETWEDKEEEGILPALKISYQRLPTHLKRCFLYCSIFPKDYKFDELFLVQFWIAHGLIVKPSNPNENLEDVGLRYVRELISKCFFQDVEDAFWTLTFKIHDLMHDLASSLAAQNEFSVITSQNHTIPKTIRHLSVLDSDSFFHQALPKFPNKLDRVRTLLFACRIEGPTCKTEFEKYLSEFKHLRSLEIMDYCELLPERIGALKHLRYLRLDGTLKFERLPKSIFKLQNLQALCLSEGVEELPKEVRYLISLRFLELSTKQKRLLEGGLGCLESLQTLSINYCENLEYLCEDMQGLKSLRKFCITECQSLISLPRSMNYLTALEFFAIDCCGKLDLMTMEEEKEVEIKPLSLQTVGFFELPATLALPSQFLQRSVNSLQRFYMGDCPNIRELPECIGDLKKLQNLEIWDCPGLSERCQRGTGDDWPKIAHIPQVVVDEVDIQETS